MKDQIDIKDLKGKVLSILNKNIQKTLDSIPKQIAVLNRDGKIIAVNSGWKKFGQDNGLCSPRYCLGDNYIEICKAALKERENFITKKPSQEHISYDIEPDRVIEQTEGAQEVLDGIEKMLSGDIDVFSVDYPCHSLDEKRWFKASLIHFAFDDEIWIIVSHENITQSKLAEINLRKSEDKLTSIIQSIPDAMCMIDREYSIVWANDVAKELYRSSLIGDKCYRAYKRCGNICQNCIARKTFTDGKVHSGEYSHLDLNGNEITTACTSSVAGCDEVGNITHVMEIMRDITQKRKDQKFLKFMQIAVDTTGDGVYWINPDGSIKYVNQSVLKYTGFSEQEILSLKVYDIDPNLTIDSWIEHWNELRHLKTIRLETVHRTKDGAEIPFEVTASHVIFEEGDEYNFALVRNISERTRAEQEIRRLSQAVEHSPVSVVITDINGTIEYVNRKFTQVTGYTREEASGENPRILSSGQMSKLYYKNLWKTILSGSEWTGEFINKKKSGEIYWEAASISPVMDKNGTILYFVAIKEDITDRKKMVDELKAAKKKAELATRAKSDFLATMSHEIRTPMNAIMGMSHLLMDTELDDIQYGYLSNIKSAANSLLSIINDILDLSKIEAGKMEFESIPFEWNQLVEQIFNLLKFNANEKKLELIYSFGKNIPQFVVGDPTRISQVMMNLVGNAVKYTPSGEVAVHAELAAEDDKTITLRISVKDTGIGIRQSKIPSLFKPFTQVDSSTTRKYGGTGLGLVIAKRIVNKMGGEIDVESTPEKGSTFTFNMILNKAEQPASQNSLYTIFSGLNVMVVEPHMNSRRAISTMLKSLGMRVMAASNGEEAVELAQISSKFDVVMINANLPVESIRCTDVITAFVNIDSQFYNDRSTYSCNLTNSEQPDITNYLNQKTKYIVIHEFTAAKQASEIAKQVHVDEFIPKPITPIALIKTFMSVLNIQDKKLLTDRAAFLSAKDIQEEFKNNNLAVKDKNILVVDDDEMNRQIVAAMVKKAGFENISVALNGDQAVKIAHERFVRDADKGLNSCDKPFDLIFMDVEMPVMDGLEATRKIRQLGITAQDSKGISRDIPVIALTGHALDEYREKCFKAGMNAHIDKPIKPEKLFSVLQKWLI